MKNPLQIVFSSVRANLVPMVVLWAVAYAIALFYYCVPSTKIVFDFIRSWQESGGWIASFVTCAIFCGVLPGVFLLSLDKLRVPHPFAVLAVQMIWSGICGVVSQGVYAFNAFCFGEGTDIVIMTYKTLVFQFVSVPLFYGPVGALVYFWIGRNFSFRRCRQEWSKCFWQETLMPSLIANWIIWVPCSYAVFVLPTVLQVQLTGFVNSFYSLLLIWIGRGESSVASTRTESCRSRV